MPQIVDETQRRQEISEATLKVAERDGANAVTIRAVAEELGRSTAFVTNYVPSRAQLMFNALDHARELWLEERDIATENTTGVARLIELSLWMCQTNHHDTALRSLWIEVIAGSGPEAKVVTDITDNTLSEFQASAAQAELLAHREVADILYLFARGFHVKNVEDPGQWNDERVGRALTVLHSALLGVVAENPE